MTDLSKISVVLPSLDPDDKLTAVIDGLLEYGFTDIILVNDGSKPENLHYFEDARAAHPQVHLLHHPVNRGKGAALKTAFRWFLENRPESLGVVTVDGDNQHHPEDTRACSERLLETGKLILGVRDFSQPQVPPRSRMGNRITCGVFRFFVGMTISDTQTGLRAIPRKDLQTLVTIYGDRFEYETNMLLAMKDYGIPFEEVKIRTVYIEENKSSHFRTVVDSWRIYKLILKHFFRYGLSSIASAVIDTSLFALLSKVLYGSPIIQAPQLPTLNFFTATMQGVHLTVAAGVGARIVSSLFNFFANHRLVFQSKVSMGKAFLRYYALALPQMAAQVLLTQGVCELLGVPDEATLLRTVLYALVMCLLFIASYLIQQRWVFAAKQSQSKNEV